MQRLYLNMLQVWIIWSCVFGVHEMYLVLCVPAGDALALRIQDSTARSAS